MGATVTGMNGDSAHTGMRALGVVCALMALMACLALGAGCSHLVPSVAPVDERPWDTTPNVQSADDDFAIDDQRRYPYENRYFYTQLDDDLKVGYRSLYAAMSAFAPTVWYPGDYNDSMQLIARSVFMDCPEFFYARMIGDYTGDGIGTLYRIGYMYTEDDALQRRWLINQKFDELYAVAAAQPDQASQAWAAVQYMAEHIDYHWDAAATPDDVFYDSYFDTNTLYGALVNEHALCGGYAMAFELLCYRLGIPCIYVEGEVLSDTYSGAHAWNLVYINGAWTNVDPTWSDDEQGAGLRDDYFMASDAYHNQYVTGFYLPAELP